MIKIKINPLGIVAILLWLIPAEMMAQKIVADDSSPQEVTSGYQFTEGPYWHPDGYLFFSDIPANTIFKWMPGSDEAEIFMKPSGHSNGITARPDGNLIIAQHDGMISMLRSNKTIATLAKSYEGQRLNSPNDLTVASDGTIYFTDPPFGVSEEDKELSINGVYILREDNKPELMYDDFDRPNGIVLSPDESKIYVNNTSDGQIMVFEREENGELTNPQKFANVGASSDDGAADGMVIDKQGRLYSTGPGGIYVFSDEGNQLQHIEMPSRITNMGWGGAELNTLYLTAPSAIYSLDMAVTGAKK